MQPRLKQVSVESVKGHYGSSVLLNALRLMQKRELSRFSREQAVTSHMRSKNTLLVKLGLRRIGILTLGAVCFILAFSKGTLPRAVGITAL